MKPSLHLKRPAETAPIGESNSNVVQLPTVEHYNLLYGPPADIDPDLGLPIDD